MNPSQAKLSIKNEVPNGGALRVKLISWGEQKQGNFGPYNAGQVEAQGKVQAWDLSPNMRQNIERAGFGPGDEFAITKWSKNGKTGYNYVPLNDISAQPQNVNQGHTSQMDEARRVFDLPPEDGYEPAEPIDVKILRGQCVNLAESHLPKTASQLEIIVLAEEYRTGALGN